MLLVYFRTIDAVFILSTFYRRSFLQQHNEFCYLKKAAKKSGLAIPWQSENYWYRRL